MKVLEFKCTLLSDVILNMKSASAGANKTLDFIPGNCFLGIAASQLYASPENKEAYSHSWLVFHSGKVRFGDAHPSYKSIRSLRVPAAMFYPKLKSAAESCYIYHCYDRANDHLDNGEPQQLKQCRNGFYAFDSATHLGHLVLSPKSFAIKSAYDTEKRCSEDEKMFGYESMQKGQVFLFEIEVDDSAEDCIQDLIKSLTGDNKRIGRSRTAQYGLVKIDFLASSTKIDESRNVNSSQYVTVYADGRLIFLDEETGLPTYHPTAKQLGLDSGWSIDWTLSQIRTFQYAPWNSVRQAFDMDRCGIEKGSVFVLKRRDGIMPSGTAYVGCYNNEGFGKVIYNPSFLDVDPDTACNGQSLYKLIDNENIATSDNSVKSPLKGTPLLDYLNLKKQNACDVDTIYKQVDSFINSNAGRFRGDAFASQWGTIRSLAQCSTSVDNLIKMLDDGKNGYLSHGVAQEKWDSRGRKDVLMQFINGVKKSVNDDKMTMIAVINLASEMAKKCKREA